MKQKKFKIKIQTLVKFKGLNSYMGRNTEPTTTTFTTTSNTSGIFNK